MVDISVLSGMFQQMITQMLKMGMTIPQMFSLLLSNFKM